MRYFSFHIVFIYVLFSQLLSSALSTDRVESIVKEELQLVESSEGQAPHHMYVRLLRDTIAGTSLGESELSLVPQDKYPGYLRKQKLDMDKRRLGSDWPWIGLTHIGISRLNLIYESILHVALKKIPGDFLDTDVWRGGSSAFALGTMLAYNYTDTVSRTRKVWVVDRFPSKHSGSLASELNHILFPPNQFLVKEYSKVNLPTVKTNFYWLNLLDTRLVEFIQGPFSRTLPELSASIQHIAVLRISTDNQVTVADFLYYLYPLVSDGGWIIIENWERNFIRKPVNEFLRTHEIDVSFIVLNERTVYWTKTIDVKIKIEQWIKTRQQILEMESLEAIDVDTSAQPQESVFKTFLFYLALLFGAVVSGQISISMFNKNDESFCQTLFVGTKL